MKKDKINFTVHRITALGRNSNYMTTGRILTELRKEKEIGQKELAVDLNVSVGTVSNYENDVHSPDLSTLCKLADFFGVTTDYLLGRTSYRKDPIVLNRRVSDRYTITDIVNTMLTFESSTIDHLMDYARYLQTQQS